MARCLLLLFLSLGQLGSTEHSIKANYKTRSRLVWATSLSRLCSSLELVCLANRKEGGRLEGQSIRCSFTSTDRCNLNAYQMAPDSANLQTQERDFWRCHQQRRQECPCNHDLLIEKPVFFSRMIYHFSFLVLICEVIEFVRIGWYCNRNLVGKPSTKCFSLLVALSFIAVNGLCLAESQLTVEVMFCSAFCPWCKNYLNASWQTRNKHLNISTFEHNDKHLSSGPGQCG